VETSFGSYIYVTLHAVVEEAAKLLLLLVGVGAAHAVLVLLSSPSWRSSPADLGALHAALWCSTGASFARLQLFTNAAKLCSVWPYNSSAELQLFRVPAIQMGHACS